MARRIKQINGYRSGFENKVASALSEQKVNFKYEVTQIEYITPRVKYVKVVKLHMQIFVKNTTFHGQISLYLNLG